MKHPFRLEEHCFDSTAFRSVVDEAVDFYGRTPLLPLPPPVPFGGAGVYALFYRGGFQLYQHVAERGLAIYVGKAVPPGWRTARLDDSEAPVLFRRLGEHARSIHEVENLELGDFQCRFMLLPGAVGNLIVPIEAELIRRHRPLWNTVIDGFGNHDPGSGRYDQSRSEWDVLHPGRPWVARLRGHSPTTEDIVRKVHRSSSELF